MKRITFATIAMSMAIMIQTGSAETPPEIESLQNSRARKIEAINRIYRQELEKLKLKYTKLGNLEAANLTVSLIKEIEGEKAAEKPLERDSRWSWGSGGELLLKSDGTAMHTKWNRQGSWIRKDDGSILLEGPFGAIRINLKDEIGTAVHIGSGNVTTLSLKK